jgi:hypothetical protein
MKELNLPILHTISLLILLLMSLQVRQRADTFTTDYGMCLRAREKAGESIGRCSCGVNSQRVGIVL